MVGVDLHGRHSVTGANSQLGESVGQPVDPFCQTLKRGSLAVKNHCGAFGNDGRGNG